MANQLRIVFMGTPAFAVESLNILVQNGYDIAAVVTAPDKPCWYEVIKSIFLR
jgi:methionyl-tRNA formyltransferase